MISVRLIQTPQFGRGVRSVRLAWRCLALAWRAAKDIYKSPKSFRINKPSEGRVGLSRPILQAKPKRTQQQVYRPLQDARPLLRVTTQSSARCTNPESTSGSGAFVSVSSSREVVVCEESTANEVNSGPLSCMPFFGESKNSLFFLQGPYAGEGSSYFRKRRRHPLFWNSPFVVIRSLNCAKVGAGKKPQIEVVSEMPNAPCPSGRAHTILGVWCTISAGRIRFAVFCPLTPIST